MYAYKVNNEVIFKIKKPSKKIKFIELSNEDHSDIRRKVNDGYRLDIVDNEVVFIAATTENELTRDDIDGKIKDILVLTKDSVTVPDYKIDGVTITQEQIDDMIRYRRKVWTVGRDFDKSESVVWPKPPFKVDK